MATRAGSLAGFVACCLLGLVALPATLGPPQRTGAPASGAWPELVWLAGALAAVIGLLAAAPGLVDLVRRALPADERLTLAANDVARLLVAAAYVVLTQAIVRRPLVLALETTADSFVVEAALGGATFVLALLLFTGVHRSAVPLLERVCLAGLDAIVATTASEAERAAEAAAWQTELERTRVSARGRTAPQPTQLANGADVTEPSVRRRRGP
jgi:hypothetical protein